MNPDKILIVDDEADIALILKLQLEDSGFATVRARDGLEALERLDEEQFDLVLLDIKMPRLNGLQVLKKIQEDGRREAVIMMTAHGNEDIAVETLKIGALDYIAKPFSAEDLEIKVKQAIQLNRARRENTMLQEKLEEERQKTEAILQGMADVLVALDERGTVVTVNRKGEEILGSSMDALVGLRIEDVIKVDIPELPGLVAIRTGAPCLDVPYNIKIKERSIPVLSSANPLFDAIGHLVGAVEIIRDVSGLRALEQDKEDFVSMLSHDLKTPITSIVGSLDLVREGRLGFVNDEQKEFLEMALESCEEMKEMINTLLDVHKFEAGKMVMALREESPGDLVQKTIGKFRSVATRSSINLFATMEASLPGIRVDRGKFTRLLYNLLSNAVKFTPEKGTIEAKVEMAADLPAITKDIPKELYPASARPVKGKFLLISITDSGTGIPREAIASIFDRYEQAKSRRLKKTEGTGLGLAFCRRVMDAHNGLIWAESSPGSGSRFRLLLPVE